MMKWAFSLAHSTLGRFLIGRAFTSLSFAIPVKRLRETKTLIAFPHPQPSYPVHILIVPKKVLGGLSQIGPAEADFLQDLFETVRSLVSEYGLEEAGYRLIANGGKYQEVAQVHFHLVADSTPHPGLKTSSAPSPTRGGVYHTPPTVPTCRVGGSICHRTVTGLSPGVLSS